MVRQPASQRAVAQNEINKDNMKIIRNIARRPWPRIGDWLPVVMLICGVLASCSSEDESTAPLPDGKYPLQLTAEVAQPQTRAGGKDAWTGGEEIRVSLEGVFGNKTYVMDASGNASPKDADNAFYWKNTDEARVSAWTPDIESETDISDQSGGYAAFDVLYASAIGRYDQAINLRFIHRMAKIEVILKAGEGITEEELEGATVTIFGDPLTHSTAGLVSPGDQSDGEIKPYYDAATKKYEALVPPQDMTGKPLIRISIGSNDFTYTPETEAAGKFGFFGGKRYAYTITVKANGIDVQSVTSGTWVANGEENVTSKRVKQRFTADELKIGDYFYSDGTWSDGGLVSIEADGLNPVWADTKPAPVAGKTVIGIVCQTDENRIAAGDKEKGYTHGYVVAVKNAHSADSQTVQYSTDNDFASTPKAKIASTWYGNVNGYEETMKTVSDYGPNLATWCPAFDLTVNNFSLPAPETSSGWFLPSTGQLWDMVANLCGHEAALLLKEWQTSSYNVYYGYNSENVSYDVIAKFNETLAMIPADQKEELFVTDGTHYNTCTLWATTCFEPGETACIIHIGGSEKHLVELMCEYIDYDGIARPILAF